MTPILRLILLCGLVVVSNMASAILPLPYPIEPLEEEDHPGVVQTQDPKSIPGLKELFSKSQLREMELPEFGEQPEALGYVRGETFVVPAGLRSRVDFWKKIYSEYTSDQAVLHDADYPEIVYGVVEIGNIANTPGVTYRRKMRAINRFLKKEKEKVARQLVMLQAKHDDPNSVPVELFPIFRKFENLPGSKKFLEAKKRIRAQVGQRDKIVQGFLYGGRYFGRMMEIFEQKKVPKELTRLPLVESAFNLAARSKVGASGVWQFMRSTGKRFLKIDKAVDERNDPITATWAAAELLRSNYEALGNWSLAITAYNHGREGMARAVRKLGTTDLTEIIRRYDGKLFGFASSNFYTEFVAILEVERDYRKHFGKMLVDKPIQYEEFTVADAVKFEELADACSLEENELALLNPALTDFVLSGKLDVPSGFRLKVPPGKRDKCASGYRNIGHVGKSSLDSTRS